MATQIMLVARAQYPSLGSYSVSKISTVYFNVTKTSGKEKNNAEIPPWIIPGGYRSYFFVDGSGTYIWSSKSSLIDSKSIDLDGAVGPNQASQSYINEKEYNGYNNVENWKRNYHAIYSAVYINEPAVGPISLGFLHGENKNEIIGNKSYQNTIQPNVTINPSDPNSYSGGTPFHDGWNAYNAIISAAWTVNNKQTNWGQRFFSNDLGPIVWPSTGYVTRGGVKCTSGLRHPSALVANEYVYIFYTDSGPFGSNIPAEEGRSEGIKVARAPLSSALDPNSYKVYYRDPSGRESWLSSLPVGFTKEHMLDFVAVKGPKTTDIMRDDRGISDEIRFSVAKVRNTDYFIGVEEYMDLANGKKYKVALRFSTDLIHWTNRALIVATASTWNDTNMNYPIFLSNDGWSNTEIDIDDFYLLGTGTMPGNYVNKIHLTKTSVSASQSLAAMSYNWQNISEVAVYPNPTQGSFVLAYGLGTPSLVQINLFDAGGNKLATIDNEQKEVGKYVDQFDISTYPGGVYFIETLIEGKRRTYKLIKNN